MNLNAALTAKIADKEMTQLRIALNDFPLKVQDGIVKRALREFARYEMSNIAPLNNQLNPKHLAYRIKFWPQGIAWCGVGWRDPPGWFSGNLYTASGRARRKQYDEHGEGWRSHFAELGFHTWSSMFPRIPGQHGRGWKKGRRHRGTGVWHRGVGASIRVHQAVGPRVREFLAREIAFQLDKEQLGKRARRTKLPKLTLEGRAAG